MPTHRTKTLRRDIILTWTFAYNISQYLQIIPYTKNRLRAFANANAFSTSIGTRTLSVTNFMPCELNPIRTSADELLLTNLLHTNFFRYEIKHAKRLHTNCIRYELFGYEPSPLRTFYTTIFCRYEHFTIRTLSHTNICIRTLAYEHFSMRTLCLRTFVRLPN